MTTKEKYMGKLEGKSHSLLVARVGAWTLMPSRWTTALVVEDRQVELAEALGVGDHVDLDDLLARS